MRWYSLSRRAAGLEQQDHFDELLRDFRAFAIIALVRQHYTQPRQPLGQRDVKTEYRQANAALEHLTSLAGNQLSDLFDHDIVAPLSPAIRLWRAVKWYRCAAGLGPRAAPGHRKALGHLILSRIVFHRLLLHYDKQTTRQEELASSKRARVINTLQSPRSKQLRQLKLRTGEDMAGMDVIWTLLEEHWTFGAMNLSQSHRNDLDLLKFSPYSKLRDLDGVPYRRQSTGWDQPLRNLGVRSALLADPSAERHRGLFARFLPGSKKPTDPNPPKSRPERPLVARSPRMPSLQQHSSPAPSQSSQVQTTSDRRGSRPDRRTNRSQGEGRSRISGWFSKLLSNAGYAAAGTARTPTKTTRSMSGRPLSSRSVSPASADNLDFDGALSSTARRIAP